MDKSDQNRLNNPIPMLFLTLIVTVVMLFSLLLAGYYDFQVTQKRITHYQKTEKIRSDIKLFDEILTSSIFLYVHSQDQRYKEQYQETAVSLDSILRYVSFNYENEDIAQALTEIEKANSNLLAVEDSAFSLIASSEGLQAEAVLLLNSTHYLTGKSRYNSGLNHLSETLNVIISKDNEQIAQKTQIRAVILVVVVLFLFLIWAGVLKNLQRWKKTIDYQAKEIKRQNEDLHITLYSIHDGVITLDSRELVTRMNRSAEEILEVEEKDAVNVPIGKILHVSNWADEKNTPLPLSFFTDPQNSADIQKMSITLKAKSGTRHNIAITVSEIRRDSGELIGTIIVFSDITKEISLQEQLRHADKMNAIGELAGGVAHDFNNMLGGIIGAAEIMGLKLKNSDSGSELYEFQQLIMDTASRAAGLTKKLLTFARKTPIYSTAIEVHPIIEESISLLKNSIDKQIELKATFEIENPRVVSNPSELQSVIMNLCINASHAIAGHGEIRIKTKEIFLDETDVQFEEFELTSGAFLQIDIEDTGKGIPPENIKKIFEPFFTTKGEGKGTGLGLAAVYGTVKQYQGAITVYSELGLGTIFKIYLPLSASDTEQNKTVEEHELKRGTESILYVDDEEIMQATVRTILSDLGYNVTIASNGNEAVEIFKANPNRFSLVILDMIMPGMNGHDTFFELRKIAPSQKVILASGFSENVLIHEMKKSGLKGFIQKPFQRAQLSDIIRKTLDDA